MSYSVDELFRFEETEGGYAVAEYLKKDDPTVTELEIPAEYNGLPVASISQGSFAYSKHIKRVKIPESVRSIGSKAFWRCKSLETAELSEGLEAIGAIAFAFTQLKSVKLPKSLITLRWGAFGYCKDLERVEFNGAPAIKPNVFGGCPKLPPETVVMGLVCSTDITSPFSEAAIGAITAYSIGVPDYFRPDVFELLAKNNCFRNCDLEELFELMIEEKPELFPVAEQYGLLDDPALIDSLISRAIEKQNTEITAYLLDLKNRKFGFNGGDKFEL